MSEHSDVEEMPAEEVEEVEDEQPVEEVKLESEDAIKSEEEQPAENNSKKSESSENTSKKPANSEKSSKKSSSSENTSSSNKKRSSGDDSSRHSRNKSKRPKKESSSDKTPSTRTVYIANIPYEAQWQDIKDLIKEKIPDCEYVQLFADDDGKARGCGLVEFKDPNSATKALELFDKYDFKGRKLVVKKDFDSQRDHTGRIVKDASLATTRGRSTSSSRRDGRSLDGDSYGGSRHGSQRFDSRDRNISSSDNSSINKWGNTYGLSPQFLESLGINGQLTNRVFVANLDYKVSGKKLQEIFKLAGRVQNINLKTDKDGNSKGHGLITFQHPVEAVQAVSMFHGQLLNERPMTVKMDRSNEIDEAAAKVAKLPKGLKSIGMGLGANGLPLTNVAGVLMSDKRDVMAPTGSWGGPGCNELGMNNSGFSSRGSNMGFSDRSNVSLMGGFPDRMMGMGGNSMVNSFSDRAGILGNYGDRSDFGVQNFQDRGMSGNGASSTSFSALGGGSFSDRTFATGGTSYSDRGNSNLRGGNVSGTGIMNAASGDNTRFDDYRRSSFGTSNTTAQDSEYRSYTSDDQTITRHTGPVSSTIIVRNLPIQYSKMDLMDRFLEAGKIEFTKVSGDGLGLVCFSSEREAQRAINIFDGSRLEGRVLEVAFR